MERIRCAEAGDLKIVKFVDWRAKELEKKLDVNCSKLVSRSKSWSESRLEERKQIETSPGVFTTLPRWNMGNGHHSLVIGSNRSLELMTRSDRVEIQSTLVVPLTSPPHSLPPQSHHLQMFALHFIPNAPTTLFVFRNACFHLCRSKSLGTFFRGSFVTPHAPHTPTLG